MSKYVTLNVGVRWEQQRLIGNISEHTFTNMWSPRVGISVDPTGNRKQKIYANFGRYAYVLPLDAALRSLSNEDDLQRLLLGAGQHSLPGRYKGFDWLGYIRQTLRNHQRPRHG